MSAESSCNRASQTCYERTFPKHGDENHISFLCYRQTQVSYERTFPKHGDENTTLPMLLNRLPRLNERTFPKHGDENNTILKIASAIIIISPMKEHSPNMGTKTSALPPPHMVPCS